ncbi:multidrug resistance protein, MATE family [Devosia enhydra]|uniref:Multidrug-efflux transporter n=2 Tax=Devosia enhydra TaxID=665118 RepID=A0A1K2HVI0_9HYPH|nr:multidrug resistance protein, MATE family [Devosia enhydra]
MTNEATAPASGDGKTSFSHWIAEMRALLSLGAPLILAQLAQNALFTTDVIMMGWLGPESLAAGMLATAFMNTFMIGGIAMLSVVAALVAQARGAGDSKGVRRTVRQGLWVAIAVSLVLWPILWQVRPVLSALGQAPVAIDRAEEYVHVAMWLVLPGLCYVVFRSFLSALQQTRVILLVTIGAVALNALLNWALIFGNFGMPRLELRGAAIATLIVNIFMFAALAFYAVRHRRFRRYHVFARFWRADWQRFLAIIRVGAPIGFMVLAEVALFSMAAVLMGRLGTNELAAHAVALQCASTAFMVPLGLSQATTVRVGLAYGAGDRAGVARAGWGAMIVTLAFMTTTCLLFIFYSDALVGLFLDQDDPANFEALRLAATYVVIGGIFQLVDGAQVSAAGALRGLSDTTAPMIIALLGYWAVGFPIAWIAGIVLDWRGVGVWLGLAGGLAFVAVVLTTRFAMRERLGLLPPLPAQ